MTSFCLGPTFSAVSLCPA